MANSKDLVSVRKRTKAVVKRKTKAIFIKGVSPESLSVVINCGSGLRNQNSGIRAHCRWLVSQHLPET